MNRLEKLILEIKKQLLPYHHEHDVERGCERWEVENEDCLTSWIAGQLTTCRQKNRCDRRGLCAYYSYSDLAKRNYEICREVILILENGDVRCVFRENKAEK